MPVRQTLRMLRREWLIGLLSYAVLVAPFGCQFQMDLLGGTGLDDLLSGSAGSSADLDRNSPGLFVNPDKSGDLIAAGRNAAGDAFYVYGTWTSGGAVGEIESILVKTAAGESSYILFQSGRPAHLQGADGSYVRIEYTDVAAKWTGTASVYDAASGQSQSVPFEIDPLQAVGDAATTIQQLTGQTVTIPDEAAASAKLMNRANPILFVLFVLPMIILTKLMIVVMAQMMAIMMATLVATMTAAMTAAFLPCFLFAGIFDEVTVDVQSVPFEIVFESLPPPPVFEVTIET